MRLVIERSAPGQRTSSGGSQGQTFEALALEPGGLAQTRLSYYVGLVSMIEELTIPLDADSINLNIGAP